MASNHRVDLGVAHLILKQAGVELHESQRYVFDYIFSTGEDVLVRAGRRWGKTYLAAAVILVHVLSHPSPVVWIVCPERWQARKIIGYLGPMAKKLGLSFSVSTGEDVWADIGDVRITGKVSTSRTGLYGEGLTFVVEDEAALSPGGHYYMAIEPSLLDHNGQALFLTTPYVRRSWLDELVEKGMVKCFEYPNWMNPHLPLERILRAREMLPESVFRSMYAGEAVDDGSVAFPNRPIIDEIPPSEWLEPWVLGLDWGYQSPFAAVLVHRVRGGKVFVSRELYGVHWTIRQQALAVKEMLGSRFEDTIKVADAATFQKQGETSIQMQWAKEGLYVVRGTTDSIGSMQLLWELLSDGRLVVSPNCRSLINEFEGATIDPEKPADIIGADHALDALRYALVHVLRVEEPFHVPIGSLEWFEALERKQRGLAYASWREF